MEIYYPRMKIPTLDDIKMLDMFHLDGAAGVFCLPTLVVPPTISRYQAILFLGDVKSASAIITSA
jgi:hypothetical protein